MSNESQYYSPIIQSMIASAQQAQQQRELQQKTVNEASQQKIAQQHTDIMDKEVNFRHEHESAMDQHNLAMLKSTLAANRQKALYDTAQAIRSGVIRPEAFQQPQIPLPEYGSAMPATPPGQLDIPGAGRVPSSTFFSPQESAQMEAQRVQQTSKAESQGKAEGALPSEQALQAGDFKNKQQLQKDENEFKASQGVLERGSKEKIAGLERSTQAFIANGANATRLQVAGMEYNIPNSQLESGVYSALTGQRKFSSDNRYDRAVTTAVQGIGARPLDPKDIDTLKQSQLLIPTLDKVQNFIDKYLPGGNSPKDKIGAFVRGKVLGMSPVPLDGQNELAEIKTGALNTARNLEGLTGGKVTQQQMQIFLDGLTAPGITKPEAQARLDNIREMMVNKENNVILGGLPTQQKQIIYKEYGITPAFLQSAPKSVTGPGGKNHPLDIDKSIELGHPVYDPDKVVK